MQNTFSQSGNDSKWFSKKSFFRIGMWHSRLPRDPPTLHGKTILNFHFDYLTPSLSQNVTDNAVDRLNLGHVYIEPECDEYIEIINYSNNNGPNIYSDIPL